MKAHEYYSRAMLLAADRTMSVRCRSMAELSAGWTVDVSPLPAHRCISERLTQPEGKQVNQSMALLLGKVPVIIAGTSIVLDTMPSNTPDVLTVEHARLWQYMSSRLISQPAGLLQFQMELAILLEELASPSKPRLQLVPA